MSTSAIYTRRLSAVSETLSAKAAPTLPRRPLLVLHAEQTADSTYVEGVRAVKPGHLDYNEWYAHAT
jgi:hypothetical protein